MISEGTWGIYQSKASPKTKHIFAGEHALDPNAIIIAAVSGQDYEDNAHLIAASKLLLAFVLEWAGHGVDCDFLDDGSPCDACTCGYDKARDDVLTAAEPN